MKQKYTFLFLAVLSAVFSCVQIDESKLDEVVEVEKVEMTFTATIEKDADTRTELGGNVGDALRKVYWQPSDKIGVSADNPQYAGFPPVEVFTSAATSRTEMSEFTGNIAFAPQYRAFYPYSSDLVDSSRVFVFNLPQVQKYVRGTFDPNAAPMVAKADAGEELQFKNLCGILALQLKGTGSVKSVTFMGRDALGNPMPVSGKHIVRMDAEDYPRVESYRNLKSSITLECGEPVALSSGTATPFYIVLPPATYESFIVLITMADGKVMVKEGVNPLTIKRSDIANASPLAYVESVAIDLSDRGNSNCYIVPKAGLYSFDASVIGNREFGILDGFHTDSEKISPSSVSLLWEDRTGVVLSPSLDGQKVKFIATGREGNALLAVKDENGKILWSWHIWATDQPQEQVYVNDKGTFTMLDRNLGATHNASDDWDNSRGLVYQWGRKDPFTLGMRQGSEGYIKSPLYSSNSSQASIEDGVNNPTIFEGVGYRGWVTPNNMNLWSPAKKTIYDPCPVGYKVATRDVWAGFLQDDLQSQWGITEKYNVSGGWSRGWNFIYDGTNTTYFPTSPRIDYNANHYDWDNDRECALWTSEFANSSDRNAYRFYFYYSTDADSNIELYHSSEASTCAFPVRCMKDEGYVDTSLPTVHVKNVTDKTVSSARIVCEVTYPGSASVTERGFIWGTSSDLTGGTKVACGSGTGEFAMNVTGLSEATRYFVKPYAVNSYGTSYGEVMHFMTPYSGEGTNLSQKGCANTYMIYPQAGVFYFDASVKGNSEESVGVPASAELVWAVDENHNASENILDNVELNGDLVFFKTTDSTIPGNALIAVKDENGTILWSWHIWVVDYDPSTQNQTYYSGAVMMDRNLGATLPAPDMNDYTNTWKPTAGAIYQWGRKDPIIYENVTIQHSWFNSIEESVQNPVVFGAGNEYWLNPMDEYLWAPDSKTMYDPCPAGWRVSPKSAWEGASYISSYYPYGATLSVNEIDSVWVGYGPYMHSGGDYYEQAGGGFTWTSDYNHGSIHGWTVRYGDYYWDFHDGMNATDAYPVRCMKENSIY